MKCTLGVRLGLLVLFKKIGLGHNMGQSSQLAGQWGQACVIGG